MPSPSISPENKYVVIREPTGLTDRPIWLVPVVNPDGVIKYVRTNSHIQSALVTLSRRDNRKLEKGEVPDMDVTLRPGLEDKGWSLLADLFHQDNMDAAWAAFQKWMAAGPMAVEGGEVRPFPSKYLPSGVEKRKARSAAHQKAPMEITIPELDERIAGGEDKKGKR